MNIDREQQREILQILANEFPWKNVHGGRKKILEMFQNDPERTSANLLYLQMHGLIDHAILVHEAVGFDLKADNATIFKLNSFRTGNSKKEIAKFLDPQITVKGIDFLLGDNGLSAILNVTTLRIEDASIRQIASILIDTSQASKEEKESAIDTIKRVPLIVIKDWLTELVEKAMPSHEATLELVRSILQHNN